MLHPGSMKFTHKFFSCLLGKSAFLRTKRVLVVVCFFYIYTKKPLSILKDDLELFNQDYD